MLVLGLDKFKQLFDMKANKRHDHMAFFAVDAGLVVSKPRTMPEDLRIAYIERGSGGRILSVAYAGRRIRLNGYIAAHMWHHKVAKGGKRSTEWDVWYWNLLTSGWTRFEHSSYWVRSVGAVRGPLRKQLSIPESGERSQEKEALDNAPPPEEIDPMRRAWR